MKIMEFYNVEICRTIFVDKTKKISYYIQKKKGVEIDK